jgi:Tol biopolymer transport system component
MKTMSDDLRPTLDRGLRGFEPSSAAFERTMRRVDRKARVRRIGAGLLALAIVAVAAGVLVRALEGDGRNTSLSRTISRAPVVSATTAPPRPTPLEAEIVGLDGTILRRINGLPANARQLALSPDGKSIAFTIPLMGHHGFLTVSEMDVLSIDSGHWALVAWGDSKWEPLGADSPSWSPDGTRLAFVATTWAPGQEAHGIDIVRIDGGGHRKVTGGVASPSWSPDGSELAYVVPVDPLHQIYIVPVQGGGPRRLAAGDFPDFSPDGSKIAFVGPDDRIVIVNSDGTGAPRYLGGMSHPEALAWSPDGTKIAFLSGSCGAPPFLGQGVSIVEVATGAVTTVVQCRAGGVGSGPSWLPASDALLVGS